MYMYALLECSINRWKKELVHCNRLDSEAEFHWSFCQNTAYHLIATASVKFSDIHQHTSGDVHASSDNKCPLDTWQINSTHCLRTKLELSYSITTNEHNFGKGYCDNLASVLKLYNINLVDCSTFESNQSEFVCPHAFSKTNTFECEPLPEGIHLMPQNLHHTQVNRQANLLSLYWRCESSEYILSSRLCDGNRDCVDGTDEVCTLKIEDTVTFTFTCDDGLILPLSLVDDLMPDCLGGKAEDEPLLEQLNRGLRTNVSCISGTLSCIPGHSKCYPPSAICVFDHDNDANLR